MRTYARFFAPCNLLIIANNENSNDFGFLFCFFHFSLSRSIILFKLKIKIIRFDVYCYQFNVRRVNGEIEKKINSQIINDILLRLDNEASERSNRTFSFPFSLPFLLVVVVSFYSVNMEIELNKLTFDYTVEACALISIHTAIETLFGVCDITVKRKANRDREREREGEGEKRF